MQRFRDQQIIQTTFRLLFSLLLLTFIGCDEDDDDEPALVFLSPVSPENAPQENSYGFFNVAGVRGRNESPFGSLRVDISRTGGTKGEVSVDWTGKTLTALAGIDFNATSGTLTWADGESTTKTAVISIIDDVLVEGDETVEIVLSNPTGGATIETPSTVTNIIDDDTPDAGVVMFLLPELNAAEGQATFDRNILSVGRAGSTLGAITVDVVDTGTGSATSGADYTFTPLTCSWGNLENLEHYLSQSLEIHHDSEIEGTETIVLGLTNPTGGAVIGTQETLTIHIIDVDTPVQFEFEVDSLSVDENDGTAVLRVVRTGGIDATRQAFLLVNVLDSGTAQRQTDDDRLPEDDYSFRRSLRLSWNVNSEPAQEVIIEIINDSLLEVDETAVFELELENGHHTLGPNSRLTLTIVDDDNNPGVLAFETGSASVNEADANVTFNVTRTGGTRGEVEVKVGLGAGTTASDGGVDFSIPSGQSPLSWADGDGSPKTFTINVIEDSLIESEEKIELILSDATGGATIGTPDVATLSIIDDDTQGGTIEFQGAKFSVVEDEGTSLIKLSRVGGSNGATTVEVMDLGTGTAGGGGVHYSIAANPTLVTWADGESGDKSFEVFITDDNVFEADRDVEFEIVRITGTGTLGALSQASLCISDDEPPPGTSIITIEIDPANVEFEEGLQSEFTIHRTGDLSKLISFDLVPGNGTASFTFPNPGGDWQFGHPTAVTFGPGIPSRVIPIISIEDSTYEGDETIIIEIENLSANASLGTPSSATFTILDDDCPPNLGQVQIKNLGQTVREDGGMFTLTLERVGGSQAEASVRVQTTDVTAIAGTDFTAVDQIVTWNDGDSSDKEIQIPILNNNAQEGNRFFSILLDVDEPKFCPLLGFPINLNVTIEDDD